jgi:threonine aldolase
MTEPCRDFSSDNIAPAAPEMLEALARANRGAVHSYGDDELTRRLEGLAAEVFERELAIYPVATGTAANALALSVLAPPYGGVFCHETAHIEKDECGAPEFFSGGAKLLAVAGAAGKIAPGTIAPMLAEARERGVHQVRPAAISLSQATEWGTVYAPDEVAAQLGVSPAAASWRAGVDVLSFGATKNGALAAEAVIFFDRELAGEFEYRRKRGGHLLSKMRFCSAQLVAYLEGGLWLRLAARANAMAARLAAGLQAVPGVRLTQSVQANELFPALPETLIAALQAEGFGFYRWPTPEAGDGGVIRLVTAWNTTEADVDFLLSAAARLAGAGG